MSTPVPARPILPSALATPSPELLFALDARDGACLATMPIDLANERLQSVSGSTRPEGNSVPGSEDCSSRRDSAMEEAVFIDSPPLSLPPHHHHCFILSYCSDYSQVLLHLVRPGFLSAASAYSSCCSSNICIQKPGAVLFSHHPASPPPSYLSQQRL